MIVLDSMLYFLSTNYWSIYVNLSKVLLYATVRIMKISRQIPSQRVLRPLESYPQDTRDNLNKFLPDGLDPTVPHCLGMITLVEISTQLINSPSSARPFEEPLDDERIALAQAYPTILNKSQAENGRIILGAYQQVVRSGGCNGVRRLAKNDPRNPSNQSCLSCPNYGREKLEEAKAIIDFDTLNIRRIYNENYANKASAPFDCVYSDKVI